MNKVLLSPVAKNENGLLVRGFFVEPLGFGRAEEVAESNRRLGSVAVKFEDFKSGLSELSFNHYPDLINHDHQVTQLVRKALEYCGPTTGSQK